MTWAWWHRWFLPLVLAWQELNGHRLRTAVTAMAIFLGVGSLLVMTALSRGMEAQNREMYLKMGGAQVLQVTPASARDALQEASFARSPGLRLDDVAELRQSLSQFDGWVPEVSLGRESIQLRGGPLRARGVASSWERFGVLNLELDTALDLVKSRWESGEALAVVGADVARKADPNGKGIGAELVVRGRLVRIAGVFKSQGKFDMRNFEVLVPLEWMRRTSGDANPTLDVLKARVARLDDVAQAPAQLKRELVAIHRGVEDIDVSTNDDLLENSRKTIKTMSLVTLLIAGVSLLSGAVGILNVQLASLSSRVRELGTAKALGARSSLQFRQMLLESVLVSALGGIGGMVLGILPTLIPAGTLPWRPQLGITDFLLAGAMVAVVGVVAGLLPAIKASRLDPVEAMRA